MKRKLSRKVQEAVKESTESGCQPKGIIHPKPVPNPSSDHLIHHHDNDIPIRKLRNTRSKTHRVPHNVNIEHHDLEPDVHVRQSILASQSQTGMLTQLKDDMLFSQQLDTSQDAQVDIGWDCNSPLAVRNLKKLSKTKSSDITDIVMKLDIQLDADLPSCTPPLLGMWFDEQNNNPPVPRVKFPSRKKIKGKLKPSRDNHTLNFKEFMEKLTLAMKSMKESESGDDRLLKQSTGQFDIKSAQEDSLSVHNVPDCSRDLFETLALPNNCSPPINVQAKSRLDTPCSKTTKSVNCTPTIVGKMKSVGRMNGENSTLYQLDESWSDDELFQDNSFILKATQCPTSVVSPLVGGCKRRTSSEIGTQRNPKTSKFSPHSKTDLTNGIVVGNEGHKSCFSKSEGNSTKVFNSAGVSVSTITPADEQAKFPNRADQPILCSNRSLDKIVNTVIKQSSDSLEKQNKQHSLNKIIPSCLTVSSSRNDSSAKLKSVAISSAVKYAIPTSAPVSLQTSSSRTLKSESVLNCPTNQAAQRRDPDNGVRGTVNRAMSPSCSNKPPTGRNVSFPNNTNKFCGSTNKTNVYSHTKSAHVEYQQTNQNSSQMNVSVLPPSQTQTSSKLKIRKYNSFDSAENKMTKNIPLASTGSCPLKNAPTAIKTVGSTSSVMRRTNSFSGTVPSKSDILPINSLKSVMSVKKDNSDMPGGSRCQLTFPGTRQTSNFYKPAPVTFPSNSLNRLSTSNVSQQKYSTISKNTEPINVDTDHSREKHQTVSKPVMSETKTCMFDTSLPDELLIDFSETDNILDSQDIFSEHIPIFNQIDSVGRHNTICTSRNVNTVTSRTNTNTDQNTVLRECVNKGKNVTRFDQPLQSIQNRHNASNRLINDDKNVSSKLSLSLEKNIRYDDKKTAVVPLKSVVAGKTSTTVNMASTPGSIPVSASQSKYSFKPVGGRQSQFRQVANTILKPPVSTNVFKLPMATTVHKPPTATTVHKQPMATAVLKTPMATAVLKTPVIDSSLKPPVQDKTNNYMPSKGSNIIVPAVGFIKTEATELENYSEDLFLSDDEDALSEPQILEMLDFMESQAAVVPSSQIQCTPEEIKKKREEALRKRSKYLS